MSAYDEICSMFETKRKMEEAYKSAAYSQMLTFVELFEFYIGSHTEGNILALRMDEKGHILENQTERFRFVDQKLVAAVCLRTANKRDTICIPMSVKPLSLVECSMEIGYETEDAKEFNVNFSYGAIGIKQTSSDNALSYLESLLRKAADAAPYILQDTVTESID